MHVSHYSCPSIGTPDGFANWTSVVVLGPLDVAGGVAGAYELYKVI